MERNMKKQERLQSREEQDPTPGKVAETEREKGSKLGGTGATERVKPASRTEVSPNTPSGQET
jgi:hypothetical protein